MGTCIESLFKSASDAYRVRFDDEDAIDKIEIRVSQADDINQIETLYPIVFPDEDLLPVVRELLGLEPIVLSLVGISEYTLVGHISFTTCSIGAGVDKVSLLGPLAVAPAWQRQGVGTALVYEGLKRLEQAGMSQVYVLGDPAYYKRFGFASDASVSPPYALPDEWHDAWQSLSLGAGRPHYRGKLSVPNPWQKQALWGS